jgi:hypothetical protein
MGRAVPALLDELRRLGFSEGQNLTMDYRSTNKPVAQCPPSALIGQTGWIE